jgi:ribosomal protein S18 acetylase RimI-like enzyme
MEHLEVKTLSNISTEIVYEAFLKAFSDYEVPMNLSFDDFKEMLIIRDINFDYSIGCFNDKELVGFIICGYREIGGKKLCYDGGTGIVKEFRRKGIASKLLSSLIDLFQSKGIDEFILEVLENNISAIDLYRKNGFVIQRKFQCFEINKSNIKSCSLDGFTLNMDIKEYHKLNDSGYLSFDPSWQNQKASILNNIDNYGYCSLSLNDGILGFGFIDKNKGTIPQLGIVEKWRNKGLEQLIINQLKHETKSEQIKLLNIESNNYWEDVLIELGFSNFINQYEMVLPLN